MIMSDWIGSYTHYFKSSELKKLRSIKREVWQFM